MQGCELVVAYEQSQKTCNKWLQINIGTYRGGAERVERDGIEQIRYKSGTDDYIKNA